MSSTEEVKGVLSSSSESGPTGQAVREEALRAILPRCRPEVQAALMAYVQRVAAEYAEEIVSITLYGSQARGEATEESDIDLFIVIRHDTPALREALADLAWEIQFKHGVVISDIIRSVEQLEHMRAMRFPYYQHIEEEGVLLWRSTSKPMPAHA